MPSRPPPCPRLPSRRRHGEGLGGVTSLPSSSHFFLEICLPSLKVASYFFCPFSYHQVHRPCNLPSFKVASISFFPLGCCIGRGASATCPRKGDGLPGLIVDQYGEVLVLQCLSVGTDQWRDSLVGLLNELTECTAIYERSDAEVRKLEGLEPRRGLLSGTLPEPLQITEQGLTLEVDVEKGQKTGL